MSAKWRRSLAWDDRAIPSWAWPAKAILRAFSSIPLAVVLLTFVSLYAVFASVPIGMLALAPTYLFYGLTILVALFVVALVPCAVLFRVLRPTGRALRFAVTFIAFLALAPLSVWLWHRFAWPPLHYDPLTGSGVRFFADFVERYDAVTVRRLPGFEMTELEFYGWWPFRIVLVAFVINMITATVRRIEFSFPNIGVLTVHTGIVLIALGSLYYNAAKREGDTMLRAGQLNADGTATPGQPQRAFYDNTRVALFISTDGVRFEQRPLSGVPRYNEYDLGVSSGDTAWEHTGRAIPWAELPDRRLDRLVATPPDDRRIAPGDMRFRIVGYAPYATSEPDWLRVDPDSLERIAPGTSLNPVQFVTFDAAFPDEGPDAKPRPRFVFTLAPRSPVHRVSNNGIIAVEVTEGMTDQRFAALAADLSGAAHGLVVRVPSEDGEDFEAVYNGGLNSTIEVGDTGYTLTVSELHPQPPFPILTQGYENADSSVAVVRVEAPDGRVFDRYVYHRFNEISNDLYPDDIDANTGRPARTQASDEIDIEYVDASHFQLYLDREEDGTYRAVVRRPGEGAVVREGIEPGGSLDDLFPEADPTRDPRIAFTVGQRWEHAELFDRPVPVPEDERERTFVGSHDKALVAVRIETLDESGAVEHERVVWLPFMRYFDTWQQSARTVTLPDGRRVQVAFGRLRHPFRDFQLTLLDFRMIAYDHRGAPRDYQSDVLVSATSPDTFQDYEHTISLNYPLSAPFQKEPSRSAIANTLGHLRSRLDPNQFKLSQAGWDQEFWNQTQLLADQGQVPRPYVRYTILGVGNNAGIHVVALGGILMAVGIPWAFYIKPLIMKQRKTKIQKQLARDAARAPERTPVHAEANA